MIGRISRFAATLVTRADDTPDEAATDLQVRRPLGSMDMSAPSCDRQGAQYDAYRGIIYAAVDKIAKRVAQIPLHLFQYSTSGEEQPTKKEIYTHPFLSLFGAMNGHKPHEEYSVWELDYTTSISMDLTGEAWWLVERDELGRPARVTPLPSNRMTVVYDKDTGLTAGYKFTPRNCDDSKAIYIPKQSWEDLQKNLTNPYIVFHRYPSPLGVEDPRGWSPVKAAAYAYDINLYEQIYKRNFLKQGAQLGGILQSDVALNRDQIDEYLHQFQARHSGPRKAGIPIVLPKMLKWTTTEPTPRDIQWVETVKQTESQILQIYGISDAKLGRADVGNRATADAMDVTFNREVIQSRLDIKVHKLNTDFLPIYPKQTEKAYFACGFDDPVPADGEMALKREEQDLKNNIVTRNEIRIARNIKPMGKFGEVVFAQENNNFFDAFGTELQDLRVPGAMDEYAAEQKAIDAEAKKAEAAAAGASGDDDAPPPPKDKKKEKSARAGDPLTDAIFAAIVAHMTDDEFSDNLYLELSDVIQDAIMAHSDYVRKLLPELAVEFDTATLAAEYMRTLEGRIGQINNTTIDAIRSVILRGISDGETIQELADDIDDLFESADGARSLTVARTETLAALNFAANRSYVLLGVPFKRWLTNMDGRERESHHNAHNQVVPVNGRFSVGTSTMDHPGDPSASAKEVCNCRCCVAPSMTERSAFDNDAFMDEFLTRLAYFETKARKIVRSAFVAQHQRLKKRFGI